MALSRQQKVIAISLVSYWLTLFILTHIPIPQLVREADVSDKSLHFLAYLILAFLLWFAISPDKKVNWRWPAVWRVLFVIVVYALVDEWLQGYVRGRSRDAMDIVANLAGTLTGLILFSVLTFWPAALLVMGATIFGLTNITQPNLADLLPIANAMFHLFAYPTFALLWVQYVQLFLSLRPPKPKWLITALAAPIGLLLAIKLFSVILGKDFALPDIIISVAGIVVVVATIYMAALFRKRQDPKTP
jgi:VanZ family protein